MADAAVSEVIIKRTDKNLLDVVDQIMSALAPTTFSGQTVLIKPNMVGPSVPELGHTTSPELVRAVTRACLDRNAKVLVGDNPGGISRSSTNVAKITGILDASEGCFTPISERVVEKEGLETGLPMVVSKAVLDADYIINLPKFKTHTFLQVTGAIKNVYGYLAGAGKARLHVMAASHENFSKAVCDIFTLRPPDLHIMDAITAIEGNGPCHGGNLRKVDKLLASTDALALDAVMVRMMGVDPATLPVQMEAQKRGFGNIDESSIAITGPFEPIPDFKMPVTFLRQRLDDDTITELKKLYPPGMMQTRTHVKPIREDDKCIDCGDCELNCPPKALSLEPDFIITDDCIACYCCVELCSEGALEVPDVEAYRHY